MTADEQLVNLQALALDMAAEIQNLGERPEDAQYAEEWATDYRKRIDNIVVENTVVTLTVKLAYADGAEGETITDVLTPGALEGELGRILLTGLQQTPDHVTVEVVR